MDERMHFVIRLKDGELVWLRGMDLNHRPLGYEPNELPDCSTPHFYISVDSAVGQMPLQSRAGPIRPAKSSPIPWLATRPRCSCSAPPLRYRWRGLRVPDARRSAAEAACSWSLLSRSED